MLIYHNILYGQRCTCLRTLLRSTWTLQYTQVECVSYCLRPKSLAQNPSYQLRFVPLSPDVSSSNCFTGRSAFYLGGTSSRRPSSLPTELSELQLWRGEESPMVVHDFEQLGGLIRLDTAWVWLTAGTCWNSQNLHGGSKAIHWPCWLSEHHLAETREGTAT